jgi:hypothetical protein
MDIPPDCRVISNNSGFWPFATVVPQAISSFTCTSEFGAVNISCVTAYAQAAVESRDSARRRPECLADHLAGGEVVADA